MALWYSLVFGTGLLVGGVAAWGGNALRVFMRSLGLPLALIALRLLTPASLHGENAPFRLFIDYMILAASGFLGDYVIGLKLGRHDARGYRDDSVGH
jgi:hypothetical protein